MRIFFVDADRFYQPCMQLTPCKPHAFGTYTSDEEVIKISALGPHRICWNSGRDKLDEKVAMSSAFFCTIYQGQHVTACDWAANTLALLLTNHARCTINRPAVICRYSCVRTAVEQAGASCGLCVCRVSGLQRCCRDMLYDLARAATKSSR